jgi:hypothetical protein
MPRGLVAANDVLSHDSPEKAMTAFLGVVNLACRNCSRISMR